MNYVAEREYNIIKNIAKEIVLECITEGFEETQELAHYLVQLKLLNPKNGFTASEVMPRSLTQQLVLSVVKDLKQDTPAMNCLRMQVYWNTINLNFEMQKKEFLAGQAEKADSYFLELLSMDKDDSGKLVKSLAQYILTVQNLGNVSHAVSVRETMAAIQSVFKSQEQSDFLNSESESRVEFLKTLVKKVTGIRLYLKSVGKAGDAIEDVKNLMTMIDNVKEECWQLDKKIEKRIENIKQIYSSIVAIDYLFKDSNDTADYNLPSEFDANDLKHLKQILTIMLQHNLYINDVENKLEEIDGNSIYFINELDDTLKKLQTTIRDRDAVPTAEIYDDFIRAGELWIEIQCCNYSLQEVKKASRELQNINKEDYFIPTALEEAVSEPQKRQQGIQSKLQEGTKHSTHSSLSSQIDTLDIHEHEDFHLEFNGFCAWTLYYGEGYLIQGHPRVGFHKFEDHFYSFSTKLGREFWEKNPYYYLTRIYEYLRVNPELIELLNAYDTLYNVKDKEFEKKSDRKIFSRTEIVQTILHPIEKYWDKDYSFSEWEHKKKALMLSRMIKCVTRSVQTENHSHFRSSIAITAAPNKDVEVQSKKDSSCVHSAVAQYLYGLRGHRDDKFKVLTLTRPVQEACQNMIFKNALSCKEPKKKFISQETDYKKSCHSLKSDCAYGSIEANNCEY